MPVAAMEVKSTTHGASLRPKVLDPRPYDLPPDVVTGRLDVAALWHRTAPLGVAFRSAQRILTLCIRAVTLDVRAILEDIVALGIGAIPQSIILPGVGPILENIVVLDVDAIS
jgi:hypothetical protein